MQRASSCSRAARRAEHPARDRDAVERPAQRREAVGRADPALRARRLDRRAARLGARADAHGVPVGDHRRGQAPAPAAAADDQYPRHGRRILRACAVAPAVAGRRAGAGARLASAAPDDRADPRHDGQDRRAVQAARLRLPVLGDLRRRRLDLRLRPLRRAAEEQRQERVVARDAAGARRHRRDRLGDPAAPARVGGLRPPRRLHRPARRLPHVRPALPRRPPRRARSAGANRPSTRAKPTSAT